MGRLLAASAGALIGILTIYCHDKAKEYIQKLTKKKSSPSLKNQQKPSAQKKRAASSGNMGTKNVSSGSLRKEGKKKVKKCPDGQPPSQPDSNISSPIGTTESTAAAPATAPAGGTTGGLPPNTAPQPQAPQPAQGSAWNLDSYHYEEQDFSKWGELKLKELLNQVPCKILEVEFDGAPAELSHSIDLKEMGGSAWTHIRKGKKIVGYDYELGLRWEGDVFQNGLLAWTVGGGVEYELTVDAAAPTLTFTPDSPFPWAAQVQQEITSVMHEQCQKFVDELQQQGGGQGWTAPAEPRVQVGQYTHYEQSIGKPSNQFVL